MPFQKDLAAEVPMLLGSVGALLVSSKKKKKKKGFFLKYNQFDVSGNTES